MNRKVGVRTGGVSGLIWGVLLIPYTFPALFTADVKDQIMSFILMQSFDPGKVELIYGLLTVFLVGFTVIACGVVGIVLGVVYGWAYETIPGKTSLRKGLIFGGFFWIIQILGGLGIALQRNLAFLELLKDSGIALAYSLTFGILLATFYNKYGVRVEG